MKKYKTKKTRKEIINKVADKFIEALKTQKGDWKKSKIWKSLESGLPINANTRKSYNGFNIINLLLDREIHNYDNNEWGTFKMWNDMGYRLKKNEKCSYVFFNKPFEVEDPTKLDEFGNPKKKKIFYLKPYAVFNANQVEGYEVKKVQAPNKAKALKNVDKYVENTGAEISHGGDRAYYSPNFDRIQMPSKESFLGTEEYYGTLLHELVHWTGHEKRCKRDFSGFFGSEAYAIEELVAETGSAILSSILGISQTVREDHLKYVNSWIKNLENKPEQVIKAINKSTKAIEHLDSLQITEEKKEVA
jgi:antirestriction protein ArdC